MRLITASSTARLLAAMPTAAAARAARSTGSSINRPTAAVSASASPTSIEAPAAASASAAPAVLLMSGPCRTAQSSNAASIGLWPPLRRRRMKHVNHYTIAGDGVLARNPARELLSRGESVVAIVGEPSSSFGEAEQIEGDPTDLDALRKAGAMHAKAILALSDDDSENAFVVLAVRELGTDAKAVAAVSTRKNLDRVRRVH